MDDVDRANALAQQQRDSAIQKLQQKERLVPKVDEDGHRLCLICNANINPARLQAKPSAVRCIGCQTAHENNRKQYR